LVDENVHNRFICTVLSYNTRKAGRCYYMVGQLQCPKCGMKLGKGSTFCINCGHRVENTNQTIVEPSTEEGPQTEEVVLEETELPPIEKTAVERASTNDSVNADEQCEPEEGCLPPAEELSWEDEMPQPTPAPAVVKPVEPTPIDDDTIPKAVDIEELSWEEGIDEVKVGNPFKEVEPPRVVTEEIDMTDAVEHLFPEKKDDATREAVAHLFPEGRGSTSSSFIDVVVGKPDRISVGHIKELDTPSCPSCGAAITSDDFQYPPYVFEAMGKARIERGDQLLKEDEHERAIESYEMAKLLFERADNEKGVAECTKRVDEGYDAMARFHYDQGETHLKENQFEWAIVQFKKARELYMFSTDAKKRAKCSEKSREAYEKWGRSLESEGDELAKAGNSRDALMKYQDASAKYREGGAKKRLKGLQKKIRKA
jgi:hypothetical protein